MGTLRPMAPRTPHCAHARAARLGRSATTPRRRGPRGRGRLAAALAAALATTIATTTRASEPPSGPNDAPIDAIDASIDAPADPRRPARGPANIPLDGAGVAVRRGVHTLRTSPPVRGLGPSLAAKLRRAPDAVHAFAARGLSRASIEAHGGVVTAELGPIVAGRLSGSAIARLAPEAELVEAPQPLRPLLDLSRRAIGVEQADRGHALPQRYRGAGAIIGVWDSGVDLSHPDLREVDGPSRVVALWDQARLGTPPVGQREGDECSREELAADLCVQKDTVGHGTHVVSIAAGNGPGYRGIAPDAELAIAKTDDFRLFLETLEWLDAVATARSLPMIVNLSLGGHLGPHDGTSLESQAIDAYRHLVVAAAGNEGRIAVHARASVTDAPRTVVLRFPKYGDRRVQRAWVDVWMEPDAELALSFVVVEPGGNVIAETATITAGAPGRTEALVLGEESLGTIDLDAEAENNPFNGMLHVRADLELPRWQDAPDGPGFVAVRLSGRGAAELWVDTPADLPLLAAFDDEGVGGLEGQVFGDVDSTISDLATAVSAVAVSAYSTRTRFPSESGGESMSNGTIGTLAPFSSYGPSLAPERTGPKPDLAAPGFVVVAARSRDAALADGAVSPLYRAGAGTSMAAPHVSGVAALLAGARPTMTKLDLKQALLATAARDGVVGDGADARWGTGRVDAVRALAAVFQIEDGCACAIARPIPSRRADDEGTHTRAWPLVGLLALVAIRRRRCPA
jgi:minor extracellular serine protease Vpr